jgi:hypothetical protein
VNTVSVSVGGSIAASATDSTLIVGGQAALASPQAGSTPSCSPTTFSWNPVTGADQYWLDVGSVVGGSDLWRGALTWISQVVNGVPSDGRTVYVQLFTHLNGAWLSPQRYTYTAPTGCVSQISSPFAGATLAGTVVDFVWNSVTVADQYWLDVGSGVGGSDLWRGALTSTSQLVSSLPCDGRTIYAQLFTHSNGAWAAPQRYTYTAPAGCIARITSPTPGAMLPYAAVSFTWSAATGADQYWLDVGKSLGGSDLWRGASPEYPRRSVACRAMDRVSTFSCSPIVMGLGLRHSAIRTRRPPRASLRLCRRHRVRSSPHRRSRSHGTQPPAPINIGSMWATRWAAATFGVAASPLPLRWWTDSLAMGDLSLCSCSPTATVLGCIPNFSGTRTQSGLPAGHRSIVSLRSVCPRAPAHLDRLRVA